MMFSFLKDFFFSKQTFTSTIGDLVGIAAVVAAAPGVQEVLLPISPYAAVIAAAIAYASGAVSGRKTGQ